MQQLVAQIALLDATMTQVQEEIERYVAPFTAAVARAQTIPGVAHTAAVAVSGALGADMSAFPSHKHRASWAGLCPGNKPSGGKRLSGQPTHGNPRLKALVCEVAQAIAHTKNHSRAAQYHRLARRGGTGRASLALAHRVLVSLYHMLRVSHAPCITCSVTTARTRTSGLTPSTRSIRRESNGAMCTAWSSWATRSP